MRYEVDSDNIVWVYVDNESIPILKQPCYPSGEIFINKTEADNWGSMFVAHFLDDTKPSALDKR